MHDLRFAFRQLFKAPGFTTVAVLTLALGIGLTTALFSVVYGVLLDPYPYAKSNEIWAPQIVDPKTNRGFGFRVGDYLEIARLPGVAQAMATTGEQAILAGEYNPEVVNATVLSSTAFDFLGVPPVVGRTFIPSDIKPNGEAEPVAVLTFRLWHRLFNGDPGAIGRTIVLSNKPYTVIGVMPPRFGWYGSDNLWLPMPTTNLQRGANPILRLKPGVAKEAVEQQIHALALRLAGEIPDRFPKDGFTIRLHNYLDVTVASGAMRSSLHLLLYAVGFLLLIACTNVANLQLARGAARSREIAIRLAIGASRARLVRQLLTESVVLALLGGTLGVLFAFGLTKIIVLLMPDFYVPNEARVTLNGFVLAFCTGLSVLSGILFGLAPGLQCTRPDFNEALKDGGHSAAAGAGIRSTRTRNLLVVVEVALSIVMLVGASLTVRGFLKLQNFDPGFRPDHTLLLRIPLAQQRYTTTAQRNAFAREILERIRSLPGVASVAVGTLPSMDGGLGFGIPGQTVAAGTRIGANAISAEYFDTLGIPLRAGRHLTEAEVTHADRLAVINESAAHLWRTGENPIGRIIQIDLPPAPGGPARSDVTVIGVVGNIREPGSDAEPPPVAFLPYTVRTTSQRLLVVRTHGEPLGLLNAVRAELRALDQEQPLDRPITVEEILGRRLAQPRFNMALFTALAGIALALAAAGIYSVLSYHVAQRTREIGVRMALGAERRDILRLVLGAGGRLLGAGLVIGLGASLALAKIVKSQVFVVPLLDPVALGAAATILSAVALLACYIPARRATKVDPMVALRCD